MDPEKFSTANSVTLTHVNEFCIQPQGDTCATYYMQDIPFCVSIFHIHVQPHN